MLARPRATDGRIAHRRGGLGDQLGHKLAGGTIIAATTGIQRLDQAE